MRIIARLFFIMALVAVSMPAALGQNVNEISNSLRGRLAPDKRVAVWEVEASEKNGKWILQGKVDNAGYKQALLGELEKRGIAYEDKITVLDDGGWAIVKVAVATMRTQGRHAAEIATQAVMGTPVKVLEKAGEWYRVQTPDNYIAYIPSSLIAIKSTAQMAAWRKSRRVIVVSQQAMLALSPSADALPVSDLVLGNILEYKGIQGDWIKASVPDGRTGYVHMDDVADFDEWSKQDFDADVVISTARRMLGSGYLWGGTSTKMTDCSGLTKVCYFANAIILQRDASQQATTGRRIAAKDWKEQARKGDLLFWGTKSGRVTHVGLYIGEGQYIHCSGMVKYNNLDPNNALFLKTPFLSISRIDGNVGTPGITAVRYHKWYFNQ